MKLKTLLKELDATQTDENLDKIVGIFNCFVSKKSRTICQRMLRIKCVVRLSCLKRKDYEKVNYWFGSGGNNERCGTGV